MRKTAATDTARSDTVIEAKHLVKYFDQRHVLSLLRRETLRVYALNDVSFALKRGDFCAYAGPNGAGKSTTFKLLSGMLKPQSGEVTAFGLNPSDNRIPMMRNTGVLFGNRSELWWDHPVRATFEWKKAVWGIDDAMYAENLKLLTDLLELDEIWSTFARELSLGQRMRANLALTFMHSPSLALLDEPTLGLDVLAKRQMIDFLKQINRKRETTILVTSHDMDDLMEMTSRIILINKGKLAFDGDYSELIRMTGDKRLVKFSVSGSNVPCLPGALLLARDGERLCYAYNALETPPERIFGALSAVSGLSDVELSRAPIETVIADMYRDWQSADEG